MSENFLTTEAKSKREQQIADILTCLQKKELLIVNPRRKNGLILYKPYYAEFAGPGAAIGAEFDQDVINVLPVGNLALVMPKTTQERINSYLIRRQWVKLAKQITDNSIAQQRGQVILNQFEHWFDADTASQLPNEAFALLVGVLPQTMKKVRYECELL
ncbi:hypothetical protein [Aphanothece sacrum]|uniref:Uncharacterized protein n=1 Tax=Aphanothece sacrum FPU1 TaxID=1920663 RepID=A0A401IGT5_APHSA|nr:hypothetical protein [Aphanothece sacrum]GBF80495.1 hypothetical protein AsFPU1_1896 [Aphanothece sacrum FPU1]GBF85885.1 hypothetical protein AsFPU3_2955 [Aphanothece sacrum FPU3]